MVINETNLELDSKDVENFIFCINLMLQIVKSFPEVAKVNDLVVWGHQSKRALIDKNTIESKEHLSNINVHNEEKSENKPLPDVESVDLKDIGKDGYRSSLGYDRNEVGEVCGINE